MTDLSSLPETPHQATRIPFEDLARKLGIDPEALGDRREAPDGPVIAACNQPTGDGTCPGQLRAYDQGGPVWMVECDVCGFEVGVPAAKLNPDLRHQRRLEQADLPAGFVGRRFEEDEDNRSALYLLRGWLADVRKGDPLPAPALYGKPGIGKSHLLTALCVRLVKECDATVMFRSMRGLLRDLQRFEDPSERTETWRRACTVQVLALDDIGAQQITDWRHDQIAELVDERYANERPVVLATNYRPADWEQVLDARTVSRLRGMTFAVELRGRDRRQTIVPTQEGAVTDGR